LAFAAGDCVDGGAKRTRAEFGKPGHRRKGAIGTFMNEMWTALEEAGRRRTTLVKMPTRAHGWS